MPSSLLAFKWILALAIPVSGMSVGFYYAAGELNKKRFFYYESPSKQPKEDRPDRHGYQKYSVVVAGADISDSDSSISSINNTPGTEDFSCKLSAVANTADHSSFCRISKLTINHSWIDMKGIKQSPLAATIQKTDLNTTTNYFRVDVDENFYAKIILAPETNIDVVSKSDPQKKIAKLTSIFKFFDGGIEFDKTQYQLGKVGPGASAVTAGKTYQCPFVTDPEGSMFGTCSFYAFGNTTASLTGAGYSNQQPATPFRGSAVATTLTADQYYIIKHVVHLTKAKIGANNTIQIQQHENKAFTPAGSFKDVVPVIIHGIINAQTAFILSETPSYSVVVKQTEVIADSKTLTHNHTTKNYKCKLSPGDAVNCNLVPLTLTSGIKTSITTKEIEESFVTSPLIITSATTKPTYYKLEVDPTFFSNFSSGDIAPKTINVVEVEDGAEQAVLFTLDPLFSIGDNGSVHFDKSTFIVKGADFTNGQANGTLTSGKNRFCSFSNSDQGGPNAKQCSLIDLGKTLEQTQNFGGAAEDSAVNTTKTYLVKLEAADEVGFDKDAKGENDFFIFEEVDSTPSPSTKKQIAKFPAANVIPTIMVDETTPNKYAFILGAAA